MTPELERLLSLNVVDGLGRRSLDELRRLCRQSQDWETAVSLTRRLAQGRLDMLGYEARRRAGTLVEVADGDEGATADGDEGATAEGDEGATAEGAAGPQLLFDLPDILAESHGGRTGRALPLQPPSGYGEALAALLDQAAEPMVLCRAQELADAGLAELHAGLAAFEARLSTVRRALHHQIDALHAEIGRRYRDGEATVESALR